jgi:hypothetical protein
MDKRLFCTYGIVKRLHIIRGSLAPYPSIMGRSLTIPQYGKSLFFHHLTFAIDDRRLVIRLGCVDGWAASVLV